MKIKFNLLGTSALLSSLTIVSSAQERPNILCLTIEDTSWNEFSCYGNKAITTPNIDQLAAEGILFRHAYSNSPQSSPARSGLITGCYASTYGMDQHRSNIVTPPTIFFPQLLRDAGYYCTNNSKTDYNSKTNNKICWDESTNNASYNNPSRKPDQPFYAVYNSALTHMGRIRSYHTDGRRDFESEGIHVTDDLLPNHLPKIEKIRSDLAFHLEGVMDVDRWVGLFIKDLKDKGLYDNTIIFFFSDHGGCSPRGKGYLYESGIRVPMIVRVPEKYKAMFNINKKTGDKPVCFVDLAPTMLQIAGVSSPTHYQGESFFKLASGTPKLIYGVCGNQATNFQPLRSVSDGRYKYIRRFIPYKQHALRNYYQWGIPGNIGWDEHYQKKLTNKITSYPFQCKVAEELYDISVDSFEVNNLAANPSNLKLVERFRDSIDQFVKNTVDLGFIPANQRENTNVYDISRSANYPLDQLHRLANLTCRVQVSDLPELENALTSTYPEIRFWAVVNIAQLACTNKMNVAPQSLKNLLTDNSEIAAEVAYALCYLNDISSGMNYLFAKMKTTDYLDALSLLEVLSLDARANEFFTSEYLNEIKKYSTVAKYGSQKDLGLLVRGILVNLNQIPADDIYGLSVYDEGLEVNKTRRKLVPLP